MRAEVRSIVSPDAPEGIDAFRPADPRSFGLYVEPEIGPAGQEGADVFGFMIVGTEWYQANPPGKGFRWGRGQLVLDAWDPEVVRRAIADLCHRASGDTWDQIAEKLARYGHSEFEDYEQMRASAG